MLALVPLLFALLASPVAEAVDRIVIYKAERRMALFQNGQLIREYRVALGKRPVGPKRRLGDLKTPEGSYQIVGRNARSRYYKSLKLSYPNAADRARARQAGVDPGDLIMIHGIEKHLEKYTDWAMGQDWTRGCIAVPNNVMDELWQLVQDGTQVEILAQAPKPTLSPQPAKAESVPVAAPEVAAPAAEALVPPATEATSSPETASSAQPQAIPF